MQKEEVEIYENIGWGGMSICNNCKEFFPEISIEYLCLNCENNFKIDDARWNSSTNYKVVNMK